MNVLQRAAELANDDWTEEEAGWELASLCDHAELHDAQRALLAGLANNPYADVRGIRMSRIIWRALDV